MIRFVAIALLTLANLVHVGLPASTAARLENKIVPQTTNHTLAVIDAHLGTLQPIKTGGEDLTLGAAAAIAQDVTSNSLLYQKNSGSQLPIASITKLATALVTLQRHQLTDVVTVPALPAYDPEDDLLGLVSGEQLSVENLLKALLINSANDAADTLAITDSGTKAAFSAKMNRLIASWGLEHTRYNNPSGLVDDGNYSTAADLARLAKLALTNTTLRQIVNTADTTITDTNGKSFALKNTNKLLADPRFHGVKTGFTNAAGQSFVGMATVNGHEIITVVLNSPDRFAETLALVNWVQKEFTWQ